MNECAPILICTLNRFKHFKNCVESLSKCVDALKTDLYIGLDYPLYESHWEGYELIKNYLKSIVGFNSVYVIYREVNFGAKKNFDDCIQHIFKKNESLILSEDDNEFSLDFIQYMNKSLDFYKSKDEIFAICGYNYPINIPPTYKEQNYIWTGFSGWGAGIWKDKWNQINWDKDFINYSLINNSINLAKMYSLAKIANIYIPSIHNQISSGNIHGDIVISIYLFENSKFCIFPVISKVRNNGHDGTGLNCNIIEDDIYKAQILSSGDFNEKFKYNLKKDKYIYHLLSDYFKLSSLLLIKFQIRSFINYILKKKY